MGWGHTSFLLLPHRYPRLPPVVSLKTDGSGPINNYTL